MESTKVSRSWLGWPHLRTKAQGPWHKGGKGLALIFFLPSGVRSTQKVPGAPARCQASFPIALKLFTKTFLIGSINRVWRHLSIQKPSQKHKNLTSEGRRFRSPFFLCLMQDLKAVTMGVVASIEYFWSNMANQAIRTSLSCQLILLLGIRS